MLLTCFTVGGWFASDVVQAENWTEWRGPNRNGISSEKSLPIEWNKDKNVAWRLPLPGEGGATPVIWEDKIFLISADGEGLSLLCISTAGKELWKRTLSDKNVEVRGGLGNSASPSPTTDGKHVWTLVTDGRMACWTLEGEKVWELDLQERYGKFDIAFGMTSTPIVHEGVIYMQLIHGDGDAATQEAKVVAFAAEDAAPIWEQGRPSDAIAECEHSYASPVLYDDGKMKMLLTHGADYIVAHDLKDGSEIWRCGGLNPKEDPTQRYEPTLRFVSSPATAPGKIVVPSAKKRAILCLRPNGHGDITGSRQNQIWKRAKDTPDVASPLIDEGLVYFSRENGVLLCLDVLTGEQVYQKSMARGKHFASPVLAEDKLYINAFSGVVTVVKAGKEFEILAQNDFGETLTASPAISNGTIYFRTFEALWAIRGE